MLTIIFSLFFLTATHGDYPVPEKTAGRLFYIQRNHNANTIVYDGNFDEKGILKEESPLDVYWLRYQEQGQRMELRKIEKLYAYGVECTTIKGKKHEYNLKLVADRKRKFWLVQKEPFNAVVITEINKQESKLDHIYIYADYVSFWPKVRYIELFGSDIHTGQPTYEKVWNEYLNYS